MRRTFLKGEHGGRSGSSHHGVKIHFNEILSTIL
jgi:hypothetical protein